MRVERGFTLLELIVALTILALMAAVMYGSFRLALNSYTKSQDRLEEEARKRVLQDQIARQISSIFPLRPTASFSGLATEQGLTGGAPTYVQFPLFYGAADSVTFITVAPLVLMENPGLSVVRYGLAEDEYGETYLGAMETRFMGLDSFNQMVAIPPGKPLPLIENVSDLMFEYYGYELESQVYRWYPVWKGDEMLSVPSAIRIHYDEKSMTIPVNANFLEAVPGGIPGLSN